MKKVLFIILAFCTNVVFAQTQLSDYYDAGNANRPEFSYNVTVKFQKNEGAASDAKRYTATLVQASPDSKGFYNANYDKKYYTVSQLGNIYNPNDIYLIGVKIVYECNGKQNVTRISFRNLNEQQYVPVVLGAGGKFCESIDFNAIEVKSAVLNPVVFGQIIDKINKTNSTITDQTYKSNNEEKQVTGTPNNTTAKPLDNYDANTRLYTNPMANSSNISNYNKDIQRAVIVLDVANGILDLLGPSPEKKARQQKEELDRMNAKANLELVALNKIKEKERLENEIKETEKRKEENEKRKYEFINNFGKSEMPMFQTKTINNEVYFFSYFKEIDSNAPLNVSNVFPWGKYADGTWPNKDKLNGENQKLFHSYYPTISGYYTTRKEAEVKLQEFIEGAKQYGISLKTVTFKGIEATTTKTDFWGNPVKSN
jgi:hypothetical protein